MPKTAARPAAPSRAHRRTARTGADLAGLGLIPRGRIAEIERVAERYAVAVTPALAALIDPADSADPIARQFIPDGRELVQAPDEAPDPIGDGAHAPLAGIVHRYPDRVLLTPILHCPFYCRFCFRRERVGGAKAVLSAAELEAALDYIRGREEVWEVVLTGGDPLMLPVKRLKALVAALDAIAHVAVIRIHSRVPVGDPARVSPALVAALGSEKALWLAIHCNHPRELSPAAAAACRRLVEAGIPLLGQSVLLKGVNDDAAVMEALMRAMVQNRIKPYYLHHLDRAPGTAHFRATIAAGQAIMRQLRGRVSGLCQPCYVLDIPGGHGKSPIGPSYLGADGSIEDWRGERHKAAARR